MNTAAWDAVVAQLEALDNRSVAAAARLHKEATLEDVPRLLALLESGDNFFVREAAAWPLAELVGPRVLRELFRAYQRGLDEGQDNDGFTTALLEVAGIYPREARVALADLAASADEPIRGHAKWLLDFCEGPQNEA
jgi:HEAT repeat protein